MAGIRVLSATPLLFLLAWRIDHVRPKLSDLSTLALLGFLGVFVNQVLFIIGLQHTTATNAGILMPSIPVFTVALAALFRVERIRPWQAVGIAIAVAGAVYMLNPLNFSLEKGKVLGNVLILINCVSYAGYMVVQRPILRRLPPLTVTAWSFLFGGLGVVFVSLPSLGKIPFSTTPTAVWWGMLFIVLFPTTLNYALNTWAVGRSSPAMAAVYITMQPVAAASLGAIFLGENVGRREAAGFALIIAGLALVSREMKRFKDMQMARENHGKA
jgi:drug/metabolite transporter (DMT)-like permease